MRDLLNDVTGRFLTIRYISALAVVACLLLLFQVLVQRMLQGQEGDAAVINLAGRQRMLCEKLTKAGLAWRLATDLRMRAERAMEIAQIRDEWSAAHQRLTHARGVAGMGEANPPEIAAQLRLLEPDFSALLAAAGSLASDPAALGRLLAHEPVFLQRMEEVVRLYQEAARQRVARLMHMEIALCTLMLGVLILEACLVFRPAVSRLRVAVAERARLQQQELVNRELSVAADTARSIGMDLHDGLCQTLTAMSMQAQALEKALAGQDAQHQAGALVTWTGQALDQVRAAARRLCPLDIATVGVAAALEELAEATRAATGVDCRAEAVERLSSRGGEDLYHIAQEAVANALRHGHAQSISIRLCRDGASGMLEIMDDGTISAPPSANGLGLRSMHHRAQRLGGALAAGPRAEGGWRVACTFPIVAQTPRASSPGATLTGP